MSDPRTPSPPLSSTRRTVVEGAGASALTAALVATQGACATIPAADASLYERLGGVFSIAAVVNHFSDALIRKSDRGPGLAEPGPA